MDTLRRFDKINRSKTAYFAPPFHDFHIQSFLKFDSQRGSKLENYFPRVCFKAFVLIIML